MNNVLSPPPSSMLNYVLNICALAFVIESRLALGFP